MHISYHLAVEIADEDYDEHEDDYLRDLVRDAIEEDGTFSFLGFFNLTITDSHDRPDSRIRRITDEFDREGSQPV